MKVKEICVLGSEVHAFNMNRFIHNIQQGDKECPLCYFKNSETKKVIIHLLNKHKGDAGFINVKCIVPECMYTTKTWLAYKAHCRRKHNLNINQMTFSNSGDEDSDDPPGEIPDQPDMCTPLADEKQIVAKYLLSLEAGHKISSSAVDSIVSSTETLVSNLRDIWQKKILSIPGAEAIKDNIHDVLKDYSFLGLSELQTRQRRGTFYKDKFMLVKPQKALLGSKYMQVRGKTKLVKKFGYFVPLEKLLDKLLMLPELVKFVSRAHDGESQDTMHDVCDGSYIKSHPLTQKGEIFLQFILSYDDVELQNPLRSNKTHKLAMFYITLLNIPPQYRSQLHNIFLLAIARAKDLKRFGLQQLLGDFVLTVKLLRHDGMLMHVGGQVKRVWGDLIFAVCDTPAAAFLGGFKESSFALKHCRMCTCNAAEMKTNFVPSTFHLRDRRTYEENCRTLNDPALAKRRSHWSTMYGINQRSVLCDLGDFPITENLIQDSMHCLLEGVCGQEIALFLHRIIFDLGLVSLNWLNHKLQNFPYDAGDASNRPNEIEKAHITLPNMFIKQKASVILTLTYILPLILGEICTCEIDPNYQNFLACMKIVMVAFSPYADETTAGELEQLMFSYCTAFVKLYPEISCKPKMHYMLHLPRQILKFGPLRQQNTFRFEAKHGWFKDYRWKNFINLPLSLSEKHQLFLANCMTNTQGSPSTCFVYKGDIVKEGEHVCAAQIDPSVIAVLPQSVQGETSFYKTHEVHVDGLRYIRCSAVVISQDDFEFPTFGHVREILCCSKRKFLVLDVLETKDFLEKYNAYEVVFQRVEVVETREISSLQNKWPLPVYACENKLLITNRFSPSALPYSMH